MHLEISRLNIFNKKLDPINACPTPGKKVAPRQVHPETWVQDCARPKGKGDINVIGGENSTILSLKKAVFMFCCCSPGDGKDQGCGTGS